MNASPTGSAPGSTSKPSLNLARVLGTVLIIALVGGAVFGVIEYLNNQKPVLVKATGQVTWKGKPVTIGAVMTEHTKNKLFVSIGAFDSEGRFDLMSNGEPGAAVGTHKVVVASYGAGMGTTPLVPKEYLKAETTPLEIVVTRDPAKNHFQLEVVGEPPDNSGGGPPGGGGGGPPGGGGGGPPGGGGGGPPGGGGPRGGGRPEVEEAASQGEVAPATEATPQSEAPANSTPEASTAAPAE